MYGTALMKPITLTTVSKQLHFPVSQVTCGCITNKGVGKLKFVSGAVD
jgi:hypothetical protein